MAGRKSDFTLPTNTLDDLFSTQEERDEAKLREDEDMFQLVESIKETEGLLFRPICLSEATM